MKIQSLILYGSQKKLTNAHKLVSHPSQPEYYVRVECVEEDYEFALDAARPQEGETVLNTVPINEPTTTPS